MTAQGRGDLRADHRQGAVGGAETDDAIEGEVMTAAGAAEGEVAVHRDRVTDDAGNGAGLDGSGVGDGQGARAEGTSRDSRRRTGAGSVED